MAAQPEDRIDLAAQLLTTVGHAVTRIAHDPFQLRIDIDSEAGHTIVIEGETTVAADGLEPWTGTPEGDDGRVHTRSLIGCEVIGVQVLEDSTLRIDVTDGQWVQARASDDFEAWEIHTDDGLLAVCMPGGGFALWLDGSDIHEG
ncbi:MAG: DUF6188 family protein [Micrococcales bacterium]|nr:DUF6188 family protein [Micrococcales bacterium]